MRILWLNWKDLENPQAGGAEVVTEELCKRLAADGHEVTLITSGFPNAEPVSIRDGYTIVRIGGRYTCYFHAWRYYRKRLRGRFDLIIDEMNTLPFFARLYAHERVILFVHQLSREIWFYEISFPISLIGYILEPLYLRLLSVWPPSPTVVTVSESTKRDLVRHGFKEHRIKIISEGIHMEPLAVLDVPEARKFSSPTLLSLGAIRPMKRTLHIIEAFEIAKQVIPDLRLIVAGDASSSYGALALKRIKDSKFARDIDYHGRISEPEKKVLMRRAHILAVTSVKEGWGLVVTEAASQGTPAAVYDTDGLRDSVRHEETGKIVRERTPPALAQAVTSILRDPVAYSQMRAHAWRWSREITFAHAYSDFLRAIGAKR